MRSGKSILRGQLLRNNIERAWKEGRTIDFLPLAFDYKEKLATTREEVRTPLV